MRQSPARTAASILFVLAVVVYLLAIALLPYSVAYVLALGGGIAAIVSAILYFASERSD